MAANANDEDESTGFFRLPPVLRQQIYSYLISPKSTFCNDAATPYYDFHPALLDASRQFRQDGIDYLRDFSSCVVLSFQQIPAAPYGDYYTGLPALQGLRKMFVSDPDLTVKVSGSEDDSNQSTTIVAGPEALYFVVQGYWHIVIGSKVEPGNTGGFNGELKMDQILEHEISLSLGTSNRARAAQKTLLQPFLRVHQKKGVRLFGPMDASWAAMFEQEHSFKHRQIRDDHYVKQFFDQFADDAKSFYKRKLYFKSYHRWNILDGYWRYLLRLADDERPYQSIVRYMSLVFSSHLLEMVFGRITTALHFGEPARALDHLRQSEKWMHLIRLSRLYKAKLSMCVAVCLFALGEDEGSRKALYESAITIEKRDMKQLDVLARELSSVKVSRAAPAEEIELPDQGNEVPDQGNEVSNEVIEVANEENEALDEENEAPGEESEALHEVNEAPDDGNEHTEQQQPGTILSLFPDVKRWRSFPPKYLALIAAVAQQNDTV